MSKKLRKPLSWLLALCMILSLLPMSVFAATGSSTASGDQYITLDYGTGSANLTITVNVYYNGNQIETFSVHNGARSGNEMYVRLQDSVQDDYDIEEVAINPDGGAILTADGADAWDLGIWSVGNNPDITINVTLCDQFVDPEIEGGEIDTAGVIYYRAYDSQLLKMLYLAGDRSVDEQTDIKSVQIRFVKNYGTSNTWSMIEMPSAAENLHYFYPTAGLSDAGGRGNPYNIRQLEITYEQGGQEKTVIVPSGDLLYSNVGGNTYEIKANADGADDTNIVAFYNEDDGLQGIFSLYDVRFVDNGDILGDDMPQKPEYNNSDYIFANWAYDPNGGDAFTSTTPVNSDLDVYAMKMSSWHAGTEIHVLDRENLLLKRFVELYNAQNPTAIIDSTDIDWNNIKIAVNGADGAATNKDYYNNEWKNSGDYYYINNFNAEGAVGDTKNTHIPVNEISGITIYAKDVSGNDLTPIFISRGDNCGQIKVEQTEWDHIIDMAIVAAPSKPADDDLIGPDSILGKVQVECTNTEVTHAQDPAEYAVLAGSYEVGEVTALADGGYTCDVTVSPDEYVSAFIEANNNVNHTTEDAPKTITLTWDDKTGEWVDSENKLPVTFEVKCDSTTPPDPEKPNKPEVGDLDFIQVEVGCTNTGATHTKPEPYGLLDGGYTIDEVQGNATDGYTCTVTVTPSAYVAKYNDDTATKHDLYPNTQGDQTITVKWTGAAWVAADSTSATVKYTVKCTTPVVPEKYDITGFTKSLVYADDTTAPATGVDVTLPNRGEKVVIPANGTVTLLYKLTVTGKAGVSFTITDAGVQIFQSDCSAALDSLDHDKINGTIPDYGIATIYVTKTFTASDIKDGYVINTASIAANNNGTVDPEIKDPEVQTPAEEGKPGAPDEETLQKLLAGRISVSCITARTAHPRETFGWMKDGCILPTNDVTGNATDGWKYVITIDASYYVDYYNDTKLQLPEGTHSPTKDTDPTITLKWTGNGWLCEETIALEAECTLYTLTYDANGGTFDNGTEFKVDNIVLNTSYELGKEDNYTNPTKGTDVFLGWTTDKTAENQVYGAGDKLPEMKDTVTVIGPTTVYAVWSKDDNGDGIADAKQIVITPADITVYTGGDSYAGVVDENGNLVGNSSGIPEPGYYFTLPYALNEKLQQLTGSTGEYVNLANYIRLDDSQNNGRQWILTLYDGADTSLVTQGYIYRLTEDNSTPAKLVIKDGNEVITSDNLQITQADLFKEYKMSLDDGAVKSIVVEIKDGDKWINVNTKYGETLVAGLILEEGKLTVRGENTTTSSVTTDVVTDADAISEANADIVAVAGANTSYNINSSDVSVTNGNIALFTDDLLPNDVLDDYLAGKGLTNTNTKVDYQYLDLVDTKNGNAYVTTDDELDIYWKLPAGADPNGTFYVVHFTGLDRNYDVTDLENLVNAYGVTVYSKANNNLEVVTIGGEQYLTFATSSFSPFALVYDTKDDEPTPVPETVTVTFKSGNHGDFGWYHVTSKDVEVVKGERVNRSDIPTVYPDKGYEFIGWYKLGDPGHLYTDYQVSRMTITENTTFIAQYRLEGSGDVDDDYDVVYNANFTDGGVPRRQGYDKGETVTVSENKWFERDGYIFVGWNTEADGTGDSYDPDDTFKMPGRDVYLYAQWQKEKPGPDDTGVSRWLETEDHNAYLTGYPDSTFGADRNMTRAEVAQMFYALLKNKNVMITTSFSDVSNDAWYATAVKTMASLGMMSGYPDGTFRPDEPITRAEFATVALAFAYAPDNARCSYLDVSTSAWYYTYVAQATTYGWIGGYPDGTFRPNNSITRVEVCVIVNNMLGRTPDEDYIDRNEDELVNFVDLSDRYWGYYTIMEATNGHEYTGNYSNETWKDVV